MTRTTPNQTLSSEFISRSLQSVWHPCTQMQHHEQFPLVALSRGKGAWLFDQDDCRYLDAISSWWTNLFGHANPYINEAIKNQLETLEHAMLAGFTHEPVISLSEKLSELTGGALGHCFYASDGASAVEIALKMSFHAWRNQGFSQKQEFICLEGSYHGETLGALSVTDVALYKDSYAPLLNKVHVVPSPDNRKKTDTETVEDIVFRALITLEKLLIERAEHIAALIVEPLIQCSTGFAMYEPLYLTKVRELCNQYKIHLIADEIAVGCGRTGTFFACEQAGIWPDFITLSKGISGGYLPLSLTMTTDAIYQVFYDKDYAKGFLHSHSFTGNPLACRAALATLELFKKENVLENNKTRAKLLTKELASVVSHEKIKYFRHKGMIWAFDVNLSEEEAINFPRKFFSTAIQNEILLRPIGNTVYLMPPYILNDEEIVFLARQTLLTLNQVLST